MFKHPARSVLPGGELGGSRVCGVVEPSADKEVCDSDGIGLGRGGIIGSRTTSSYVRWGFFFEVPVLCCVAG